MLMKVQRFLYFCWFSLVLRFELHIDAAARSAFQHGSELSLPDQSAGHAHLPGSRPDGLLSGRPPIRRPQGKCSIFTAPTDFLFRLFFRFLLFSLFVEKKKEIQRFTVINTLISFQFNLISKIQ